MHRASQRSRFRVWLVRWAFWGVLLVGVGYTIWKFRLAEPARVPPSSEAPATFAEETPPALPRLVAPGRWKNLGAAAPIAPCYGVVPMVNKAGERLVITLYDGGAHLSNLDQGTEVNCPEPKLSGSREAGYVYFVSRANRIYLTAHRHLLEFDPDRLAWTAAVPLPAAAALSFTEGADGTIYAGLYPRSELIAFDPATKTHRTLTRLKEVDWPVYVRRLTMDAEGWIYAAVAHAEPTLVAFHPASGEKRDLYPGNVIRKAHPKAAYWEARESLAAMTSGAVQAQPVQGGEVATFRGGARVDSVMPSEKKPGEHQYPNRQFSRHFSDGSDLTHYSYEQGEITVSRAGTDSPVSRKFSLPIPGRGLRIYSLTQGADGAIYGSTGLPLLWYRYDPQAETFTARGYEETRSSGHVNQVIAHREKIYGGIYSKGELIVYDPVQPWKAPFTPEGNPRVLGTAETVKRPHALAVVGDRYIVMAGTPSYGKTAGGLFIHDLHEKRNLEIGAERLIPDQSTYTLKPLDDGTILGGTTIGSGTGGVAATDIATVYRLNPHGWQLEASSRPIAKAGEIRALEQGADGLIYGFARVLDKPEEWRQARSGKPVFFILNPKTLQVLHEEDFSIYGALAGIQAPRVLLHDGRGKFLALFEKAIVEIDPATRSHRLLTQTPLTISEGGVVSRGQLLVTAEQNLWIYGLPESSPPDTP